ATDGSSGEYSALMPFAYQDLLKDSGLVILAGNRKFYHVTSDTITFYQEQKALFTIPFRNTTSKFFFKNGALHYLDENGDCLRIYQDQVRKIPINDFVKPAGGNCTIFINSATRDVFLYSNRSLYILREGMGEGELVADFLLRFNFEENDISS